MNDDQVKFVLAARKVVGPAAKTIDRRTVGEVCEAYNLPRPHWLLADKSFRYRRNMYYLPEVKETNVDNLENAMKPVMPKEQYIPPVNPDYVKFGRYNDIKKIVVSKIFYPVFITGLSGNGKTLMVEQVCAESHRPMIRVNVTIETDEDDLLGGFRLINGQTVWQNGPVVVAMQQGAILLLDEIDLASNKIMSLQPILEGKGVYLKKINQWIEPQEGFNVIATANTKGQGSSDGKFMGTNVLNEAFLERFSITIEQDYPPAATERKILEKILDKHGKRNKKFTNALVDWAEDIRRRYKEGGAEEVITTRRLVHIVTNYVIFENVDTAIKDCIARFDDQNSGSFLDYWKKVYVEEKTAKDLQEEETKEEDNSDDPPF